MRQPTITFLSLIASAMAMAQQPAFDLILNGEIEVPYAQTEPITKVYYTANNEIFDPKRSLEVKDGRILFQLSKTKYAATSKGDIIFAISPKEDARSTCAATTRIHLDSICAYAVSADRTLLSYSPNLRFVDCNEENQMAIPEAIPQALGGTYRAASGDSIINLIIDTRYNRCILQIENDKLRYTIRSDQKFLDMGESGQFTLNALNRRYDVFGFSENVIEKRLFNYTIHAGVATITTWEGLVFEKKQ